MTSNKMSSVALDSALPDQVGDKLGGNDSSGGDMVLGHLDERSVSYELFEKSFDGVGG